MLAPASELKLPERLAKAAIAFGSLTIGIAVFLMLNNAILGLPVDVVGGEDAMMTAGYLMYIGVRVVGIAVAALFYLYFGDAIAGILRKNMVSWQHLVLIIAGMGAILYVEYLLL